MTPEAVSTLLDAALWLALGVTALAILDAALWDVRLSRALAAEHRRYLERRLRVDE